MKFTWLDSARAELRAIDRIRRHGISGAFSRTEGDKRLLASPMISN